MSKKRIVRRTPEQVFKLWIEALRSGEYSQYRGGLRGLRDDSFCCLGVLCDLAAKDGGPQWDGVHFMGRNGALPSPVRNFLGMSMGEEFWLVGLNDTEGADFPAIADHIENDLMPKALRRLAQR